MKMNAYLCVKGGVWVTGEMTDLIKFQFYLKTYLLAEMNSLTSYFLKTDVKVGIDWIKFRFLFLFYF